MNGVLRETRRTCTDTSTYKIDDYSAGYGAERRIKQTCRRVWELVDGEMRLVDERCDDSERIQPQREYRTHGGRARSSYSTRCTLTLKD